MQVVGPVKRPRKQSSVAERFLEDWNANRIDDALSWVDDDIEFEDASFPGPFHGKDGLERVMRLQSEIPNRNRIVIDNIVVASNKAGILFHTEADGTFGQACEIR